MKGDILTWARLKAEAWEDLRREARHLRAQGKEMLAKSKYADADAIRTALNKEGFIILSRNNTTILKDPAGVIRMAG